MFGELLFPYVSVSVAIILFEGGLSLRLNELRGVEGVVRLLISLGALVTWAVVAAAAYYILDLELTLAVLLGAVLVVTGPTVVIPLLRQIRPTTRISSVLKWEGILIDPDWRDTGRLGVRSHYRRGRRTPAHDPHRFYRDHRHAVGRNGRWRGLCLYPGAVLETKLDRLILGNGRGNDGCTRRICPLQ